MLRKHGLQNKPGARRDHALGESPRGKDGGQVGPPTQQGSRGCAEATAKRRHELLLPLKVSQYVAPVPGIIINDFYVHELLIRQAFFSLSRKPLEFSIRESAWITQP